jgi:O-antigen/teichoic acid export membrane protein
MQDLKSRTVRAAMINISARAFGFVIRITSLMILGRLLDPSDYGLVTMVTAFTGVLNMFGGLGLSLAAIQRESLSKEESSALFWMNLVFGGLLTSIAFAAAPMVSAFYHEPRLLAIMEVIAMTFVITSAGIQHGVLLQRRMRFGVSATIDICSLLIGTVVSIGMAMAGHGYWALVSMTITLPLATTIGLWLSTGWVPGWPRMAAEMPSLLSLLRFGSGTTLNGFLSYFVNNIDKLLLGRFWGTDAVGLYGRAFYLINFPGDTLNSTIGEVAFAALSRTRDDLGRLRRYFLKGYSLVVTLTLPLTVLCALFSDDIVFVVLGPKWMGAAEIFRILAPTILVFAISNPLGWLLNSLGLIKRGVCIALFSAPLMLIAVVLALPYGPRGVAAAYSIVMMIKVVPATFWALRGTGIRVREIAMALVSPLTASLVAAGVAVAAHAFYAPALSPILRLIFDVVAFGAVYLAALLLIAGKQALYLDLLRSVRTAPSVKAAADQPIA